MKEEELKAGERYNFTLLYTGQSINNKFRFESPTGIHYILGLGDMEAVSPLLSHENGIKNTENKPKYDPCRLFRKGDKVRVVEWNGRNYYDRDHNTVLQTGCLAEIWEDEKDEQEEGWVSVIFQEYIRYVPPCYLELVTPVEEMGPYSVRHNAVHAAWSIYGPFDLSAVNYFYGERYPYTQETAKAAAEAERDRLNTEYRKEKQK